MQVYLVGGAVRDRLLNYPFTERDWVVVGATPAEMRNLGYQQVGKDFPVFLHPQSKEEYALARKERKSGTGYHGFICDFSPEVCLEDDLLRRDLTINAMAMDQQGQLIDPYHGQRDLRDRVLRHVSNAFSEDPLRVLRVARFAARYAHLGFTLAPETLALMREMSRGGELSTISPERIWVELNKALESARPSVFFNIMLACDALPTLYPDWADSLNTRRLSAIDQAAVLGLGNDTRFAISCSGLNGKQCQLLCDALRSTNSARDIAALCCELLPVVPPTSAEALLTLLEKLDVSRRPQRLQRLLDAARCLQSEHGFFDIFERSAAAIENINPQSLLQQGFTGAQLGVKLREQRLELLDQILTDSDRHRAR